MPDPRLRKRLAVEAARLMYSRQESEYYTAKRKAARRLGRRVKPQDLPSNREIRDEILRMAALHEGEQRGRRLGDMRVYALWLLRELEDFRPKLIGSVCTGHIRRGSDIDIHVFSDSVSAVTLRLDALGLPYETEFKRIVKFNEERFFTHVHVHAAFEVELTVYREAQANYPFRSSITGKPIEKADARALEELIRREHPEIDLEAALAERKFGVERSEMFKLLLLPLESVKGRPPHHPEGDALYHSLQVFDLAQQARPWDAEFCEAALLHDVGKAIDPADHAAAGADAVRDFVSERVCFLIARHMDALKLRDGSLGARKARRLRESEWFDDLMELRDLDTQGREPGRLVDTVEDALERLRALRGAT